MALSLPRWRLPARPQQQTAVLEPDDALDTRVPQGEGPPPGDTDGRTATDSVPLSLRVLAAVAWRWLVVVAGLFVLLYLVRQLWMPFLALSAALLAAALLAPIGAALRRVHVPRALAALASLLVALAVLGALGYIVENRFAGSIPELSKDLQAGITQLTHWLQNGPMQLSDAQISSYETRIIDSIKSHQGSLTNAGVAGLSSGLEFFSGVLITLFTTFFLLYDGERIWSWFGRLFPAGARPFVLVGGQAAWHTLTGYIRGTVFIAAVDAVCIGIGLVILGVPLAVPLALIIFVGAFVPLVGAITTGVLAAVIALVTKGWIVAVITVGVLVLVQLVEGHLLQPLVLGRSVRVHPIAIIFAVTVGSTVAGIGGAVLAVPIVAVANSVLVAVYRRRQVVASPAGPALDALAGPESESAS